jgi:hypothetical protein
MHTAPVSSSNTHFALKTLLSCVIWLVAGLFLAAPLPAKAAPLPACPAAKSLPAAAEGRLIVIGFMGGRVRANNFVHREAQQLQQRFPQAVSATVFANPDGKAAAKSVLRMLDKTGCGRPTEQEKSRRGW